MVGIGIHTGNALRGYAVGKLARARGAHVVFGGIHTTLYPDEAFDRGGAHAVVRGDGDVAWGQALNDFIAGSSKRVYEGGRVDASQFKAARWDLLPQAGYLWASVQTVRGCSKHCSFCSVWRTDGQKPRQRASDPVIEEIVDLRRRGYRFIALADDNFYPVSLTDIKNAERQNNAARVAELTGIRSDRFEFMARLAELPGDMIFLTQITMEAAEDPSFLDAMRKAHIKGALVGVEAVTREGLKAVHKNFNASGESLVLQLRTFREHGVHVLGSFIFGLPTDREATFGATRDLAEEADLTFAQFVMLTPFCGTVDFEKWEKIARRYTSRSCRHTADAVLADPGGAPAEDVHAASDDEFGRDAAEDARRLGPVLQPALDLEALAVHARSAHPSGVPLHFETVPADVRQHGNCDRQCAAKSSDLVGAAPGDSMPSIIPDECDA